RRRRVPRCPRRRRRGGEQRERQRKLGPPDASGEQGADGRSDREPRDQSADGGDEGVGRRPDQRREDPSPRDLVEKRREPRDGDDDRGEPRRWTGELRMVVRIVLSPLEFLSTRALAGRRLCFPPTLTRDQQSAANSQTAGGNAD